MLWRRWIARAKAPAQRWLPLVQIVVAGAAGHVAQRAFRLDQTAMFYLAIVLMAIAIEICIGTTRLRRVSIISTIGHTLLGFALLLPAADFIYVKNRIDPSAAGAPKPVYS